MALALAMRAATPGGTWRGAPVWPGSVGGAASADGRGPTRVVSFVVGGELAWPGGGGPMGGGPLAGGGGAGGVPRDGGAESAGVAGAEAAAAWSGVMTVA